MKHRCPDETSARGASNDKLVEYENAADDLFRASMEASEDGDDGLGICTNGARHIASQFDGLVMGYLSQDNPDAVLGAEAGGHDFVLLND